MLLVHFLQRNMPAMHVEWSRIIFLRKWQMNCRNLIGGFCVHILFDLDIVIMFCTVQLRTCYAFIASQKAKQGSLRETVQLVTLNHLQR